MAAINQNRPVNSAKLQNSSELRKIANQDLDAAISGKWGQLSSSFTFKSHTDLKNGKFGYTFIAKCDYKNTDLAKLIKTDTNINSHYMDKWSDVGVVVRLSILPRPDFIQKILFSSRYPAFPCVTEKVRLSGKMESLTFCFLFYCSGLFRSFLLR